MYSTGEYFPDRTLVHKHTTYVPNPAGTILHESHARTPSTAVVYDPAIPRSSSSATHPHDRHAATTPANVDWDHARAGRKKRLSPQELRGIHDLGYARGIDIYQESPIDEFALTRPKGMHGRMSKLSGKTKKVLGTVMGNPYRQAVGEEKAAMGEAEVQAAREYKRHQRELHRAHDTSLAPYQDHGHYDEGPNIIGPAYAGDLATDRTMVAYSEFPRRGIEHHSPSERVRSAYPTRPADQQVEVMYHEEEHIQGRLDDANASAGRHEHRRQGRERRRRQGRDESQGDRGPGSGRRGRNTQVYL